jgi:DNA polymerase I-like protein with 3'-5' exonuclease and polymerase domains
MWEAGNEVGDGYHHAMLDRYRSGEFDPHRYLASFAFGVPESEVTPEQRKKCKPYTHGRGYLGAPRTLARNAGHPDSVGVLVCEAHEKAFRLAKYHAAELARVKRQHYVQTPLGWRCYFWDYNPKPTEVIATKIQATAADLCKTTLGVIFDGLPEAWELINTSHDSFLLHVPKAAQTIAGVQLRTWLERPIDWLGGRSWRCDVKMGRDWREVS